jgi:hypothetical protein
MIKKKGKTKLTLKTIKANRTGNIVSLKQKIKGN